LKSSVVFKNAAVTEREQLISNYTIIQYGSQSFSAADRRRRQTAKRDFAHGVKKLVAFFVEKRYNKNTMREYAKKETGSNGKVF